MDHGPTTPGTTAPHVATSGATALLDVAPPAEVPPTETERRFITSQFTSLVSDPLFPCTVARGSVAQDRVTTRVYADLAAPAVAAALLDDLYRFVGSGALEGAGYASFAAVFTEPRSTDEERFEHLLWGLLQRLHDLDRPGHAWDPTVSADPEDASFSFSLGGRAFYLVGLHRGASRLSRRFAYPAVVFNAHAQFEVLRSRGAYTTVRDSIRSNDVRLQGSVNPALEDHGTSSEAKQYSGRDVGAAWRCPLHVAGAATTEPDVA